MANEEGVLHVTSRVIGREIERLEDMPVILHLRSHGDAESEVTKNADDLVAN